MQLCQFSQLPWKTYQTIDLCKSFNPAWSSKIFYIFKSITNNRTLIELFIGFLGNLSALSICALETNRESNLQIMISIIVESPDHAIVSGSSFSKHWLNCYQVVRQQNELGIPKWATISVKPRSVMLRFLLSWEFPFHEECAWHWYQEKGWFTWQDETKYYLPGAWITLDAASLTPMSSTVRQALIILWWLEGLLQSILAVMCAQINHIVYIGDQSLNSNHLIESIKTTSMENKNTHVLGKNIKHYLRCEVITTLWYATTYVNMQIYAQQKSKQW